MPLPEDIPLIIAGAFLCTDKPSWIIVGVAAWCGILGGDIMLYMLGRRFGRGITRVPFIGKHITEARLDTVQAMFEQYGVGVVGCGRMIAGIRGAMVVCAGTIRFNFFKFIIADGLGAIVSGGLFLLLGHWIGEQLGSPAANKKIHEFKELFICAAVVLIGIFFLYVRWRKRNAARIQAAEVEVVNRFAAAEKKVTDKIVETAGRMKKKRDPAADPDDAPRSGSVVAAPAGIRH